MGYFFDINIFMTALYNAGLKPLQPGVYTHSYDHATKLFLADNYRLTPKQSFLFYVVFNFDPAISAVQSGIGGLLSFAEKYQSFETGMLVKRVELPKFQINTKTVNAYNRKNVLQTSLTYENCQISFHDDAADVITNFWNDYYTYYFRDSDYQVNQYRNSYRYNLRSQTGWGYMPRNQSQANFFSNIRIFSLHNKRFTEYMMINPTIVSWKHGEMASKDSNEIMEATMTVSYESVKYFTGYVNPVNVDGFSLLHYDNTPSPISTSTTNIYSDSGVLGALEGAPKDLAKPDGTDGSGGPLSSLLSMYRAYKNLKNVNLKNAVGTSIGAIGSTLLNTVVNSIGDFIFPTSTTPSTTGVLNTGFNFVNRSITGGASAFNVGTAIATAGRTSTAGSVRGYSKTPISGVTGPQINDVLENAGRVAVSGSLQTTTGITTAYYMDEEGNIISEFQSRNTNGAYDPDDPSSNVKWVQTTYDTEGTPTVEITYADGTIRTEDQDGAVLQIKPGEVKLDNTNVNPQSSASQAAAGRTLSRNGVRTRQVNGRTQVVGGATTGLLQSKPSNNSLSSTIGGVSGAIAGGATSLAAYNLLKNTGLTNSPIGRTVGAAIATTAGNYVGKSVNGFVTGIANDATKNLSQLFDPVGSKIRNIVGSWTGSGGYDPSKPLDNVVGSTSDGLGGTIWRYKDGTVRTVDAEGVQTVTKGTNTAGIDSYFRGTPDSSTDIGAVGSSPGSILVDSSGNPIDTGYGGEWGDIGFSPGQSLQIDAPVIGDLASDVDLDGWGFL